MVVFFLTTSVFFCHLYASIIMSDEFSINPFASVQLCAECEKTVLLTYDLDEFEVAYEHDEPHHIFTELYTPIFPELSWKKDEFPQLPGLLESSLQGCTFCEFLKEILESDQVSDFRHKIHPAPLESPMPIEYLIQYAWNYTSANERHYLLVSVLFPHQSTSLAIWCTIQAPDGTIFNFFCYSIDRWSFANLSRQSARN